MKYFKEQGNVVAAERIKTRVEYDLEMMNEVGYVKGIENYSRYLDGTTARRSTHDIDRLFS
jgi:excinuclease ABC subunit B